MLFSSDSTNLNVYGGSFYGKQSYNSPTILVQANNISISNARIEGRKYNKSGPEYKNEIFNSVVYDGNKRTKTGIKDLSLNNSYITNGKLYLEIN